ncbi:unnamed protein product [Lampetra planeri]
MQRRAMPLLGGRCSERENGGQKLSSCAVPRRGRSERQRPSTQKAVHLGGEEEEDCTETTAGREEAIDATGERKGRKKWAQPHQLQQQQPPCGK